MSLTSFLNNRDVKEKFKQEFPKPGFSVKREILAPPLTSHYTLVGTAFDYLMRFYLKYLNPSAITHKWVAEKSLETFLDLRGIPCFDADTGKLDLEESVSSLSKKDKALFKRIQKIVQQAKVKYAEFLNSGKVTNEVIKSTLLLAQLDPIFRARVVDVNIGVIDDKNVEDLKNLISLVDPKTFKANKICLLDPTFGKASVLVGGADIDLVIDDMMIDIKTTKKFEIQRAYFNQLIGYYVLYRIGGIDGMPSEHGIKRLGLYFSRYAYLYVINVRDIINEDTFSNFVEWFRKRVDEEYRIRI